MKTRAKKPALKIEYEKVSNLLVPSRPSKRSQSTAKPKTPKSMASTLPKDFEKQWDGIAKMRKAETAPVDTMGCGVDKKPDASKEDKAYHTLISLMLSAQTKDEVTHATTKSLVDEHNLSVKVIMDTPVTTLN